MEVTTLIGTKWEIKDNPSLRPYTSGAGTGFYFLSNGTIFAFFDLVMGSTSQLSKIKYTTPGTDAEVIEVYANGVWANENYKTVEFIYSDYNYSPSSLISWLEANATLLTHQGIDISYDGSSIAHSDDPVTLVLETTDTYATDDITISYANADLKNFIEQRWIMSSFYNSDIKTIGAAAFAYCSRLTNVGFPNVINIGSSAFYTCSSLTSISFPNCLLVYQYAFAYCESLTEANFPSCISVATRAFTSCKKMSSVSFPLCSRIMSYAFTYLSSLSSAYFPACKSTDTGAFTNNINLESISLPSVAFCGSQVFAYCSKLSDIGNIGYQSIGSSMFYSCIALSIASFYRCSIIYSGAFGRCYNLLSLYLTGSSITALSNSNAFSSTPIAGYTTSTGGVYGSIFVPSSLYNSYIAATNWRYFSSRFVSI